MAVCGMEHNANDEISLYQMARYISSNEAAWRLFKFPIHERHPTVVKLAVHLKNGQRVYFTEENAAIRADTARNTTLTAFFSLCSIDSFAQTLFYNQVPAYYTWTQDRKWKRRLKGEPVEGHAGIFRSDALSRVYTVHPQHFECFCLRILLHNVKGPKSFEDLKCVSGVEYSTFRQACQKRSLLQDDKHWDGALVDATLIKSPSVLRDLFAMIIAVCAVSNPVELWTKHKESLAEDLLFQARSINPSHSVSDVENSALLIIEEKVLSMGGSSLSQYGLPSPDRGENESFDPDLAREQSYDVETLGQYVIENEAKLVSDQEYAYKTVVSSICNREGKLFFLDAAGGTGKTFVTNLILANVRQRNEIALAVASSGIAATLLSGGRTAHSMFKLPLNLTTSEKPVCNIPRGSTKAKILQRCTFIVWDECTMSHKKAFEAVDRTMRDLRQNNRPMGGVTVLLAGDFRQTLPVIPRGTQADLLNASVKQSSIWNHVIRLKLTTNMRVFLHRDVESGIFAEKLLEIGNGYPTLSEKTIIVPCGVRVFSLDDLSNVVFPDVSINYSQSNWLKERAILAPRNDTVDSINYELLKKIPGEIVTYRSIDTTVEEDEITHYPQEFLNSLNPPGVPPHLLRLKVGAPIMLLRNLDPPKLCNGTRLIVKQLLRNVIVATPMDPRHHFQDVFIPRIPIIPSDIPFQFKRTQFPIKNSFCMTINKSQGQSLKVVGLDLLQPCFSHGQLYVGCSRVGKSDSLFLLTENGQTKNIVYQQALKD